MSSRRSITTADGRVASTARSSSSNVYAWARSSSPRSANRTAPGSYSSIVRPKPLFGHALTYSPQNGPTVIASYHPSRQNTNTGKLTADMMDSVFERAAHVLRYKELR